MLQFEYNPVLMYIVTVDKRECSDVLASVDELTNDIEKLHDAAKFSQETICHYEAEFKVF